jgi:hypothetical protein
MNLKNHDIILPIMIQSPCKHRFKHHAQKYTQISREKDKNNLFEKVPNAHLAYRVSVARITGKDVKMVLKFFFFQLFVSSSQSGTYVAGKLFLSGKKVLNFCETEDTAQLNKMIMMEGRSEQSTLTLVTMTFCRMAKCLLS